MTTQQVADTLCISPDTVHNLVKRGVLTPINPANPLLKRPRRLLFARADVERLKPPR
jgi:hypothetical protein